MLVGYSLGADVIPFAVTRLPGGALKRLSGVVLIGPSPTVRLESHTMDVSNKQTLPPVLHLLPELMKIKKQDILCIAGTEEKYSLCKDAMIGKQRPNVEIQILPGGHTFREDRDAICRIIAQKIGVSR